MSKRTLRSSRLQEVVAPPVLQDEPELDAADLALSSEEEYESGDDDLASLSGSDGDGGGGAEAGVDREIENAVLGYMGAAERQRQGGFRCV